MKYLPLLLLLIACATNANQEDVHLPPKVWEAEAYVDTVCFEPVIEHSEIVIDDTDDTLIVLSGGYWIDEPTERELIDSALKEIKEIKKLVRRHSEIKRTCSGGDTSLMFLNYVSEALQDTMQPPPGWIGGRFYPYLRCSQIGHEYYLLSAPHSEKLVKECKWCKVQVTEYFSARDCFPGIDSLLKPQEGHP